MATSTVEQIACCAPGGGRVLSVAQADDLGRVLKAIADPTRLRLLSMIAAADGGELCACDMPEPLGVKQPTVSHHLKVMTEAGILSREKRGVWAHYRVVPDVVASLTAVLMSIADPEAAIADHAARRVS
ncbi:helix-turn-helix transcriptional regulator [Microbacterium sp. Sa4CUA7]|uniref:Helix-turn-helix transcriptional regulator n=1 Tax=Microbacterium pullorum TaxID=2762236 RepID=A0ABR8RZ45_9MICO|nr:metalloregulator ArsR/SmtB family transcription factor [Microbacterium pullorum]MBD7956359.1 helix-turn-helix transcriptional regulator [Microbacterium pullorum]